MSEDLLDGVAGPPAPPPTRRARPRFALTLGEVSGALGDLGTFLPHIIGAITVVGMSPAGIFITFGLFYALAGGFYGLPIAVQPMKAASAAVLIKPMTPGAVAGDQEEGPDHQPRAGDGAGGHGLDQHRG